MVQRQVRVDESLEIELKKIQAKIKQLIGDVDLTHNQASQIAAKILRENPTKINVTIAKSKRGNRANSINIL